MSVNTSSVWRGQYMALGENKDFSQNPYLSVKIRATDACLITAYFFHSNGSNNWTAATRVYPSEHYVEYFFDFSHVPSASRTSINAIQFTPNGNSNAYNGVIHLRDLRVGAAARRLASMEAVPAHILPIGAKGRTIRVGGLRNATSVQVSGGAGLIQNVVVSPLSNYSIGSLVQQQATITFDCIDGVSGVGTLTVTAVGASGYESNPQVVPLTIEAPQAPTLNPIPAVQVPVGREHTLRLNGISDGNVASVQTLTISAVSSVPGVVPSPLAAPQHPYRDCPYALLRFTPVGAGVTQVTVTVLDEEGLSVSRSFEVTAFAGWNNPPTFDPLTDLEIFSSAGETAIPLTGISDGDSGTQTLAFSVSSSDPEIISSARVVHTGGDTATLYVTPHPAGQGTAVVTVTVTDNGGAAGNNGNQTTTRTVAVTTRQVLPQTLTWNMGQEPERWRPESSMSLSFPQEGGSTILTCSYTGKTTWDGLWFDHPPVDLSAHPYVSFDFRPNASGQLKIFVWDNIMFDDEVGGPHYNTGHQITINVTANQWQTVTFAFTGPADFTNSQGTALNQSWIVATLINFHSPNLNWPFTLINGSYSIRNFRMGAAARPDAAPAASVDPVRDHWLFRNPGEQLVRLTGIASGSSAVPTVTVSASNPGLFSALSVSAVASDGTATLSFTPADVVGQSNVTVTVTAQGSTTATQTFLVRTLDPNPAAALSVQLDPGQTYQTIHGFGTFQNHMAWVEEYAHLMGGSAMRVGLISNQVMPRMDNNDPMVLNRSALDYGVFNWEYFRRLKAAGVETFILTSWSPPAWMKDNLSVSYGFDSNVNNTDTTDNRLSYHLYEQFAESMVAIYRLFQEEAGIDLYAIGLQNEPTFHEPYASAILDPTRFRELIKVAGRRFEAEGIPVRLLMPEQVFSQTSSMNAYIDALNGDPEAERYCNIIATHGYAADGVGGANPSFAAWTAMFNRSQQGSVAKELWMTETFPEYSGWGSALNYAMYLYGALEYGQINLWTSWAYENQMRQSGRPTMSLFTTSQFFRYIRPGAVRIRTVSPVASNVFATSFLNNVANGRRLVSVLVNNGNEHRLVRLSALSGELPAAFSVTRTDSKTRHGSFGTMAGNGLLILPPQSVTSLVGMDATQINQAPVLVDDLSASSLQVTGTSTVLSVRADDPDGDSLTLTWEVVEAPAGASPVLVGGSQSTVAAGTAATRTVNFNAPGTYRFRVRISDGDLNVTSAVVTVTVASTPQTLSLDPATVTVFVHGEVGFGAVVSNQFGAALAAEIGWSATGGTLLSTSGSTARFRAPAEAGAATVTAVSGALSATATVTVSVSPNAPQITTSSLPQAVVGESFNRVIFRTGGEGPFVWSVRAGALPAGFSLGENNGVLSGTADATGSYSFTLAVTDAVGAVGLAALTLQVVDPVEPVVPIWDLDPLEGASHGWLSAWLGFIHYNQSTYPWVFHANHHWLLPYPHVAGHNGLLWVYSPTSYPVFGWVWMAEDSYPWIYSAELGSWVLYMEDTQSPRQFWDPFDPEEMILLDP